MLSEYTAHDCIPGKTCTHSVHPPEPDDPNLVFIDSIMEMVKNNYDYVAWRISLLAGIIIALLSVLFLKGRLPTLVELMIITGIGFLVTYFAFSWFWAHFFYPNGRQIENNLKILRDNVQELEIKYEGHSEGTPGNAFRRKENKDK